MSYWTWAVRNSISIRCCIKSMTAMGKLCSPVTTRGWKCFQSCSSGNTKMRIRCMSMISIRQGNWESWLAFIILICSRIRFFLNRLQGDRNITRVLIDELKQYDWELLVLHFLGLDHIGHVEGPFSEKVPLKLAEMDAIISTIHLQMDKWVRLISVFIMNCSKNSQINRTICKFNRIKSSRNRQS